MPVAAPCRGADSNKHRIGIAHSWPHIHREAQTACADIAVHEILKARLINRHDPVFNPGDLVCILVDAGHIKTEFRETGPRNKPDISGSNYSKFQRPLHFDGSLTSRYTGRMYDM